MHVSHFTQQRTPADKTARLYHGASVHFIEHAQLWNTFTGKPKKVLTNEIDGSDFALASPTHLRPASHTRALLALNSRERDICTDCESVTACDEKKLPLQIAFRNLFFISAEHG